MDIHLPIINPSVDRHFKGVKGGVDLFSANLFWRFKKECLTLILGTLVRKCSNKFGVSLTYSYLCPHEQDINWNDDAVQPVIDRMRQAGR